jgi:integrase
MVSTSKLFHEPRSVALPLNISSQPLESLQDLLDAVKQNEPDRAQLVRMLMATAGHICLHLGEPPEKIKLRALLGVRPGLLAYLRERGYKRNSVRSYANYLRILFRKAKELGWSICSPQIMEAWEEMFSGVRKIKGCVGIVRYSLQMGKAPAQFTEADLADWAETNIRAGRRLHYIREVQRNFKKYIFERGLSSGLPNLQFSAARRGYGIPMADFPQALRKQIIDLIAWKTARFSLGRPANSKHRPVTAAMMVNHFSRLFGFLSNVKGTPVNDLRKMLGKNEVSKYIEWALNERTMKSRTLRIFLATLRGLRHYPLFPKDSLNWVLDLGAQLPEDSEAHISESKARKWVPYDVLAQLPDEILRNLTRSENRHEVSAAAAVRDALMIRWLTILPWRQRNIRECKLLPFSQGGNLWKEEIPHSPIAKPRWAEEALRDNPHMLFWQFSFRPEETKTGNIIRSFLPSQLIRPLEEYIERYRPKFVKGDDPHALFLNQHGRPFNTRTLESLVWDVTYRYTGHRVNPHLFRDIFAVKWLDDRPEDYLTLSKILWHRNIQTTLRIYGRYFDESHGARRVEEWLELRDASRREMNHGSEKYSGRAPSLTGPMSEDEKWR